MDDALETRHLYGLGEDDVPGASLRGREPGVLTVPELKRWLACRGASRRGRKAELVVRVTEYIAACLDRNVVDLDGGANIERRRLQLQKEGLGSASGHPNLGCPAPMPTEGLVKCLQQLPTVSFATIYHHFMERSLEVVFGLRAARQRVSSADGDGHSSENETDSELFSSFRGIEKGYRFFKDGHVKSIE